MSSNDLGRRVVALRAEASSHSRHALLRRQAAEVVATTAAECARSAKDPLRRLEPLRRRAEESPGPASATMHRPGHRAA